jgi:glucosamine--fructose-6-phosphate aminotransferase (isomerizing)
MCGLFGYIGEPLEALDVLSDIASHTEIMRGGHAYGWAWIDARGRLRSYKHAGPLAHRPFDLDMLQGATSLIGHCRYATHGSVEDNVNNHPHPTDGGWLAHNGVVQNWRELAANFRLHLSSQCDSEVLARLVEEAEGTVAQRLAFAVGAAVGPCAVLALWKDAGLFAARAGNPLHRCEAAGGIYLASLATSLPGEPRPIPDHYVCPIKLGEKDRPRAAIRSARRRAALAVDQSGQFLAWE